MSRPLRVWAPRAEEGVDLVLDGTTRRMRPDPDAPGWWVADTADAARVAAGAEYAFSVDGRPWRPDPRAARLPAGVHGAAGAVDHDAFAWTDDGWQPPRLADGLVYEVHVGTFSPEGTFDGVVGRLDHLVRLGVTHVELMPVHSFPGRFGWGYDSVGLFAPHEPYGGPDGLKRLVDACHGRGLAVVLDVVYNHFGPEGNYLGEFGPYLTDRYRTPWGGAVNLGERGADEVRRFLVDNALMWLRDYHVDALRLDAVHAFIDLTATHLLEQLASETRALEARLGRPLTLIAESDQNDPRLLRGPERGGYGLDAQWSDDFHHALHVTLTGERTGYYSDFTGLADVAAALERRWVYDGRYSPFRGRRHGRSALDLAPNRFLGYLQNHDQVGNRAIGDRMASLVDPARLRVGATLVLTAPSVPLLFAGEEWGATTPFPFFSDFTDPALREAVRRGRREEFAAFGWDPATIPDASSEATFRSALLDWSEPGREPHASLLAWYRRLVDLRRRTGVLRDGSVPHVEVDAAAGGLAVHRRGASVLVNLGTNEARFVLPSGFEPDEIVASDDAVRRDGDAAVLPAVSAAVVVARPGPSSGADHAAPAPGSSGADSHAP